MAGNIYPKRSTHEALEEVWAQIGKHCDKVPSYALRTAVEALDQMAYNEGYDEGFLDGYGAQVGDYKKKVAEIEVCVETLAA